MAKVSGACGNKWTMPTLACHSVQSYNVEEAVSLLGLTKLSSSNRSRYKQDGNFWATLCMIGFAFTVALSLSGLSWNEGRQERQRLKTEKEVRGGRGHIGKGGIV